ncbi:MAG TPA: hypothetical protein VIN39_10700 [Candidatus Dormibacteraeota bacterium]|jgi:hypothetical protein
MAVLRRRWFWTWTTVISVLLIATLAGDFLLAGIRWLPWPAAAAAVPFIGLLLGIGLGFLNPLRSSSEFALVSTAVSSCLFLLIGAQYTVSIAVTPGCDPPDVVNNCFDDHAAALGAILALTGAIILMLVLWTGALGGAHLRGGITGARR